MFNFFRINDPFRILGIAVIVILIRLPYLIFEDALIVPELKWLLTGEKLGQGELMYKDVWDFTAPLSALFYAFSEFLFGKSEMALKVISFIYLVLCAFIFNRITIRNNIYQEKTYIPALVFAILGCLFFDFFTLTPPLLGLPFILIALNYIFRLLDKGLIDNELFNIGFYIGLATLFYFSYSILMFLPMAAMLFFLIGSLRKLLLVVFGFIFPITIIVVYYSLYDGLPELFRLYFFSPFYIPRAIYLDFKSLFLIFLVPAFYLILSFFALMVGSRFVMYQQKTQQTMFIYIILGILSLLLTQEIAPFNFILLLPAFAFYITHYFLLIKKAVVLELSFLLFLIMIPGLAYFYYYQSDLIDENLKYESLIVKDPKVLPEISNKKIIVLGNNYSYYKNNYLATPFLNWDLSKNHFETADTYEVITDIYNQFRKDYPEYIIDESKVMDGIFDKLPTLADKYEKISDKIYRLKVSN